MGNRADRMLEDGRGGQFESFLRVADQFGLGESDFRFVGDTDPSANQAFSQGRADALFRVRALGNPSIQHFRTVLREQVRLSAHKELAKV